MSREPDRPKDPPSDPPKPSHTAEDHMYGRMMGHRHMPWEEADHDHDSDFELLEAGSKDLEHVPLVSIGVDIGSSGTQIVLSRLLMRGPGEPAAMRRIAKSRETLYLSPVLLTPFADDRRIDADRLRGSLARACREAGISPDEIDSGVVIMTGAAARRENAAAIVEALALESGDIVAAAAGDHMEAMLAAHGSGAVERSAREMSRLVHVDIGGATVKFALVVNGRVTATAAMHGGGRQIVVDASGRIVRLEPELRERAASAGVEWRAGGQAARADMATIADLIAGDIVTALSVHPLPPEVAALFVTDPPPPFGQADGVIFSGGVAEYVYGCETRDFGDLGLLLGRALAARIGASALAWPLLPAGERIRATALGASQYSAQMSGATSCITAPARLLPRRNLQVLQPPFDFSGAIDAQSLAAAIRAHRALFDDHDRAHETAFAFRWRGPPEHSRALAFAQGLAAGLADRIAARTNLYILLEGDAALTLGAVLRQELGVASETLILDGIVLRDFDFVDIGRLRLPSGMVPVTVKSLLFGAASRRGT